VIQPDDLSELREQFPQWRFGTVWATAASGPDQRRIWARNGDVLLTAWTAPEMRLEIAREADGPRLT
jgi:alkanesulfonate monooxygenase SsuD/methylene tetrahydromethanopterin reductase-like flavin-dependent oxidoreductase (luciferase family)